MKGCHWRSDVFLHPSVRRQARPWLRFNAVRNSTTRVRRSSSKLCSFNTILAGDAAAIITFRNVLYIGCDLGLLHERLSKQAYPTFVILYGKKRLPYYAYYFHVSPHAHHIYLTKLCLVY